MKKVYIPTQEDLMTMEKAGAYTYEYVLAKTIESIIMADVIYEEEDMFDIAYDKFSEYPEIIYAIARLYPEKIQEYERAINDVNLCMQLIPTLKEQTKTNYGLDYITQFSDTVLQKPNVIRETIKRLSTELKENPRYRFEYLGPNPILDDIFSCETSIDIIAPNVVDSLVCVEPAYYVPLEKRMLRDTPKSKTVYDIIKRNTLRYSQRYGVNLNYQVVSEDKVKKLYRHLQEHKHNYQ